MKRELGSLKSLLLDAVFVATAVVLATVLHAIGGRVAGTMWVPMWWGAFVAGMLLGPIHGFVVGFLTPLVSFIVRGMPPYPFWLIFAIEIGIYGFMWGASSAIIGKINRDSYVSLYISSVIGFIMGKLAAALVLMFVIPPLAPKMASNFFVAFMSVLVYWTLKSLPGIILILAIGPIVVKQLSAIVNVDSNKFENRLESE
ncbi:ECF transporter S component [bacterium 3DAC]|nr:ECF transporter S component [Dictyoglomota bacterium]UZN22775.1 ECF transporter S component [bacterium 3DAC]